jgi:hypothetical protein
MMKRVLIVSPYFLPCNLAGVHRPKLLAQGLPQFGWEPIVLMVDPQYYGNLAEPGLSHLIPENLRIERVQAVQGGMSARLGVSDLSLRAYRPMKRRMGELLSRKEVDLVFVSVLPGYAGLLGGWAKQNFDVPFVLDYQDPWVSDWGAAQPRFSKAGIAHRLATILEPRFAPLADAITAVSNGTLDGLRKRGLLAPNTPTAEVPIGSDPRDHEIARQFGKSHIERKPGTFHVAYLGTVPEKKLPSVRALFRALRDNGLQAKVEIYFGGTSGTVDGNDSSGLGALAEECGVSACVRIEPRRFAYLDALRTMQEADALLMLGSIERHYTASKLFPYWLAEQPIVGMAHEKSTVLEIARELGGVCLSKYSSEADLNEAATDFLAVLSSLMEGQAGVVPPRNPDAFEPYGARGIARTYAEIFDNLMMNRPA